MSISKGFLMMAETFDHLPADSVLPPGWWCEGSSEFGVKNGQLWQNANPEAGASIINSVIWIDKIFEGDIRFEADVQVISAKGNVNDVVIFFMFSDPNGKSIDETRSERVSARQNLYTDTMNGYVFFFWGKDGVTTPANIRFRDCPGGHLLLETNAYEIETGKTYRLAIEKVGSILRLFVDGQKCAEHDAGTDDRSHPIHDSGLIGLKTWQTELLWDNIQVTQIVG